jgi:hypothetical protein
MQAHPEIAGDKHDDDDNADDGEEVHLTLQQLEICV